jgi:hypothetical protein
MENMAKGAKAELSDIINSYQVTSTVKEHSYPKFTALVHIAQDSWFPQCFPTLMSCT